jgi:ABC-2 type transport system permease protein
VTGPDIGLLFQRYLLGLLRNPVWLVVGASPPILYLALFTPLLKRLTGPSLTGPSLTGPSLDD